VIRKKLAEMIRQVESGQAWLEQIAYQIDNGVPPAKIAGQLSLLKVHATKSLEYAVREVMHVS